MSISISEQGRLSRSLQNQPRFLRISYFVTPFFDNPELRLLSPTHPSWLHLLEHTDGSPVSPGEVETLLPAGTPVRILNVEFPSTWAKRQRALYSPRSQPWVYVSIPSLPQPLVLVLRNTLRNADAFEAELGRYLTPIHPMQMTEFSVDEQTAVRSKEALIGISAAALEMALGYPENKTFTFEGEQKIETWYWSNGKKKVELRGGKVSSLPMASSPSP
ncbi:MAG: hypothetical protein FWD46_00655 [Cystobacterineae bacterium]|nr:hypothetical protein [Cystobacterineae bacterium]